MALHYDLTGIDDHDKLCFDGEGDERTLNTVTHSLILMCVAVGLSGITKKNVDEFMLRSYMLQRVTGPWFNVDDIHDPSTWVLNDKVIRKHIGLTTNVANETNAWFSKKVRQVCKDTLSERNRRKEKEAA